MHTLNVTTAVKPGDSFEHWHQVTCRNFSVTECRRVPDRNFRAQVSIRQFGALAINDIWSSTPADERISITRSSGDIRKDPRDYFMLWLALSGETIFAQAGREARMQPGDLVLHDQSQPFGLEFGQSSHALMISIPRALLTSRLPVAPHLTARRIPPHSKLGAFTGSMMRQLLQVEDGGDDDLVRRLGASAMDIVAMTFEAELTGEELGRGQARRLAQVKRYMLANLHDAELDLDTIAKAQNMAPRTLNRLFAREGVTPIRWLWQQRLAASFKALAEGHVDQITEAAFSVGFTDLSHFCRAFKARFGQSPQSLKRRYSRQQQ